MKKLLFVIVLVSCFSIYSQEAKNALSFGIGSGTSISGSLVYSRTILENASIEIGISASGGLGKQTMTFGTMSETSDINSLKGSIFTGYIHYFSKDTLSPFLGLGIKYGYAYGSQKAVDNTAIMQAHLAGIYIPFGIELAIQDNLSIFIANNITLEYKFDDQTRIKTENPEQKVTSHLLDGDVFSPKLGITIKF